jgi:hypothetical protein
MCMERSCKDAPDLEAHWHIDPPYLATGYAYLLASRDWHVTDLV